MAEVTALQAVRRDVVGRGYDGVLLVPAFLEAGRVTAADIHWARTGAGLVPVGETEFARDPAFGYRRFGPAGFRCGEKRRGRSGRTRCAASAWPTSGSAARTGSARLLAGVAGGAWVVVNATEYSDLDTVARGVLQAEQAGAVVPVPHRAVVRAGTARPGAQAAAARRADLGAWIRERPQARAGRRARPGRGRLARRPDQPAGRGAARPARHRRHRTGRAGGAARRPGRGRRDRAAGRRGAGATPTCCCTPAARSSPAPDAADSLAIARTVSAALSRIVRDALAARPAWVIAKGGITSHDVAAARAGHPPRRGGRPAVPRDDLGVPAARRRPGGGRHAVTWSSPATSATTARWPQVVAILNGGQEDPLMRVGWLGLGAMGAPMAGCLARAGHAVSAYDIVPGRAAALAGDGVQAADSIPAAVRTRSSSRSWSPPPDQVDQVLFGPGGAAGTLAAGADRADHGHGRA